MTELGKILVGVGALLVVLGGLLWLVPQAPWIGRLPGDVRIERPGFSLYLPLGTCLVLSLVLSLLAWLVQRLR
jgi:hypothetical protein